MMAPLLQSQPYWKTIVEGDLWEGIWAVFSDAAGGMSVVALLIGLGVGVMLYNWSRTIVMPATILAFLGGVVLSTTPGLISTIGLRLLALSGGLMLYLAIKAVGSTR